VTAASVFGFACLAMAYTPTLSLYVKDLGATPFEAGVMFSISGLLGIVLRVPSGALSTIVGRKKLLVAGAMTYMGSPLVLLATDTLPFVFVAVFLFGFANLYMPAGISLVNDVVPSDKRGEYLAYYTMWSSLGRAASPFAAGWMIERWGYDWVFGVCAALGVVSFLITLSLPSTRPREGGNGSLSRQVARELAAVFRHPPLLFASAIRGIQSLTQGIVNTYFPWYARDVAALDAQSIGEIQTGLVVGGLVARPLTGRLSAGPRRIPFILCGMLGSGALLYALTQTTAYLPLLAICAGIGVVEGICQIATIAYLSDVAGPRLFGAAIGVLGGFFDLGLVGGRFLPGVLLPLAPAAPHYAAAFGIVAAVVAGSGLLVPWLLRKPSHSQGREPPSAAPPGFA
jgi:DHA1 family multidrug resistance protein-like MFS transporter